MAPTSPSGSVSPEHDRRNHEKEQRKFVPDSSRLDAGDPFPPITFALTGAGGLRVPEDLDHPFQAVLLYRGHWCPFCQAQLKSFQTGLPKLEQEGIGVVAASADDEEHSADTVESLGLTFPVAFGLPVTETARLLGAFYDDAHADTAPYLQSTGFVLGPDRRVLLALYSTGAIGRLGWQDVLGMVQYAKKAEAR